MNKKIFQLQNSLRIKFDNIKLLEQSLIHKSYSSDYNNEKLEFLGDRVLGLILSQKLLEIYTEEKEGIIDKKFANLVNKKICAKIGEKIKIKEYMTLGDSNRNLKRSDVKIISDALEALIGAIYLDKGIKFAEKFILNYWKVYLDQSNVTLIDPKTKLQEYSLKKYKELPKYKLFKQTGPNHKPIFKVEVIIPDSKKFSANGSSKKMQNKMLQKN